MARFIDLEEIGGDDSSHPPEDLVRQALQAKLQAQNKYPGLPSAPPSESTSYTSSSIGRAFQCYPYVCFDFYFRLQRSIAVSLAIDGIIMSIC